MNAVENESDEDEDEWTDSWLVTGGSDTSLRKWDVMSGRVLDRMGVGKVRGERTLVWTVGVLGFVLSFFHSSDIFILFNHRDGTIVSGDSLGTVKFWDSKTCTQLYSFQAHGADVLCMTIAPVRLHPFSVLPAQISKSGRQSALHFRRRPKDGPILLN